MEHYAQKNAARLEMLTAYIKNPGVKSADVIKFVSDQPDFADDARLHEGMLDIVVIRK